MDIDLPHERFQVLLVHVAGGDHLAVFQLKERLGIPLPHAPAPDRAQGNAPGRSRPVGSPQRADRDDGGEGESGPGQTQELAAADFGEWRWMLHNSTTRR